MTSGSGNGLSAVASPSSVCSRQTKPGDRVPDAVHPIEVVHEALEARVVERREQAGDVQLGELGHRFCLVAAGKGLP